MREPIATRDGRLEQRKAAASLSPPVSYRDVARFFPWRGGYALAATGAVHRELASAG
jgi:hypothetical protein